MGSILPAEGMFLTEEGTVLPGGGTTHRIDGTLLIGEGPLLPVSHPLVAEEGTTRLGVGSVSVDRETSDRKYRTMLMTGQTAHLNEKLIHSKPSKIKVAAS